MVVCGHWFQVMHMPFRSECFQSCSLVADEPVTEVDDVHLLEPVLGDPAPRLGVSHPELVVLLRPRRIRCCCDDVRFRHRRRRHCSSGGGMLNIHRRRVDAVAPPALICMHARPTYVKMSNMHACFSNFYSTHTLMIKCDAN